MRRAAAIVCCGFVALHGAVWCRVPEASATPTPEVVATPEPSATATPVLSPTPAGSPTPTPELSPSPTPTPPESPSPKPEMSPTPTPSSTPEVSPIPTPSTTPEISPTRTPTSTPVSTPTISPEISPTPTSESDLIHFGDIIDVDLVGGFEYDWRGGLTAEGALDGIQTFGDPIMALCRSEAEVAADIVKAYSTTLREPKFAVRIIDRSGRAEVQLNGAVKTPMRFRLLRPAHLRELIVAAGGLTDDTSGDITIYRPANLGCASGGKDNALQTINITVTELLAGKPSADPLILSGDLITIGKAVPIYVIGAVNNPRPIYSRAGMTLSRAVATAGGLAKNAVEQKVTIFRKENDTTRTIEADLEKIRSGQAEDVELKAFDIIEVAFRGGATRKYPPEIISGDKRSGRQEPPLKIID